MIAWFAKNGVAANLLMGIILVSGIFSIRGLKMELFPDFDLDLVTISVPYPGAAPLEVEEGICKQIEEKIWDTQFGFRANHSTNEALFLTRRLQDYYETHGDNLFMLF